MKNASDMRSVSPECCFDARRSRRPLRSSELGGGRAARLRRAAWGTCLALLMCSTAHGPAETGAEARGLRPAPGRGASADAAAPAQLPARLKLRRGPAGSGGVADSELDSCDLIDLVEGELYAAVPPRIASSVPWEGPTRARAGKQTLEELLQSRSKPGRVTPQQAQLGNAPSGARLRPPPRVDRRGRRSARAGVRRHCRARAGPAARRA
jgi:hypothetical protein